MAGGSYQLKNINTIGRTLGRKSPLTTNCVADNNDEPLSIL